MVLLNNTQGLGTDLTNALAGGNSVGATVFVQNNSDPNYTPIFSGLDNGFPSSRIPSQQLGTPVRKMVHWFVPEVGVIQMYINPQSINYSMKKVITPERTKGGYNVQYWGEELTTLNISGHTGSSGVNGLNVLEEVYRAEQYLYDPIALSMAANNSINGLNAMVNSSLGNIGGLSNNIQSSTNGVFGVDPASQSILPRNVPSLASIALGIEMYYSGWVFRGFFTNFSFKESSERIGIFDYDIGFTVTQRRGYRTNSFAWQHSAIDGPSDWQTNPRSIVGIQK